MGTVLLWYQINTEKRRHSDLRRRQFQAVRAVLPADLSEICHYCWLCAQAIRAALQHFDQNGKPPSGMACPVLPERVIANLQRLVEHLDQEDADKVADMLSRYQVQHARFSDAVEEWSLPPVKSVTITYSHNNIEHLLPATIHLYRLADSMFGFSRREADHIAELAALTDEEVDRALNILGFFGAKNDDVRQRVKNKLVSMSAAGQARCVE